MRAALLNLAANELHSLGAVTEDTRRRLRTYGVESVQLEQFLAVIGTTTGG